MDWSSFITGGMTVMLTYAIFTSNDDEEESEVSINQSEDDSNIVVNNFSVRHVMMSCQTCRKLKKHKEVKRNLFQCTKCKRHVDIRAS